MTTPTSSTSSSSRPLLWLAGFGLALLVLLMALNWLARWMEGPEHMATAREELASVAGAGAVVLGSSVANQLSLEEMCLEGANIAHTGQDFFEIEALARHLVGRGDVPRLWIVATAIDPYRSDNGSPGTARRTRRIETYRMLQSLGDWRLIDGDWQGAVRAATLPALGYHAWRYRARHAWAREVRGRSERGNRTAIGAGRSLTIAKDVADARHWLSERAIEIDRIAFRDSTVAERSLASMTRLAATLRHHDARLVVVFMPVSPAMRAELSSTDREDASRTRVAFLDRLRASGIAAIDDTEPGGGLSGLQNFADATHLNRAGGLAYSRDLRSKLAAAGLVEATACETPPHLEIAS